MKMLTSIAFVGVAASTAACNMVMDLGRFQESAVAIGDAGGAAGDDASDDAAAASGDKNLVFVMQNMAPHPTQLFEFWVIDTNNRVQTHAVIDPLGAQNVTVHVPSCVLQEGAPYRLDFYADMNATRSYDGIGSVLTQDHAWRIPLVPSTIKGHTVTVTGSDMTVTFVHDTIFTDIDTTIDG
jgi:hypothetical protein